MLLARTVDRSFGEFLEQGMGLAVEHTIALLDGGLPDGLCQMALAAAGWAEESESSWRAMKAAVARSKTKLRFILGLKVKSKLSRFFLRIAKLSLFSPTFQQAIATAGEFVRDQAGDQVDGRHRFHLSLVQTHPEHSRDST